MNDGGRPTQQLAVGYSVGSWYGTRANMQLSGAVASCSSFLLLHVVLGSLPSSLQPTFTFSLHCPRR